MHKKSQGLSLNVIVVAAIALIVLIVVVALFSGRIKNFQKGIRSCASQGGHCSCWGGTDEEPVWRDIGTDKLKKGQSCSDSDHPGQCPENYAPIEGTDCNVDGVTDNDMCCIKVIG